MYTGAGFHAPQARAPTRVPHRNALRSPSLEIKNEAHRVSGCSSRHARRSCAGWLGRRDGCRRRMVRVHSGNWGMRQRYRDVHDPNDPYWPRVRRLHIYLWANGTLAAKNRYVVLASFLDLLISSLFTLFSWAWRGALLFVALFLTRIPRCDRGRPGPILRT